MEKQSPRPQQGANGGEAPLAPEQQRAILSERARRLAQVHEERRAEETIEVVAFELAREVYALETRYVREVQPIKDLRSVPCTPAFVLGIVNLRGEICPVIDLKKFFGMPEHGLTNATRAVIVRDTELEFGILADVILGVQTVAVAEIGPPPATLVGISAQFLRGVTRAGMVVLDAAAVLAHPALVVREEVS